jgi:hypothetical protein
MGLIRDAIGYTACTAVAVCFVVLVLAALHFAVRALASALGMQTGPTFALAGLAFAAGLLLWLLWLCARDTASWLRERWDASARSDREG